MIAALRPPRPRSRPEQIEVDPHAARSLDDELRDPAFYPHTDDRFAEIAVVTAHFNWSGYRRPVLNLLRFLREMDYQGIPVYGMELYLAGTEPLMARNHRWKCVEVGAEQMLWQKEPMLNRIARDVPAHIPCIAALDADIHFMNPRWAELSVKVLDSTPVIQPYSVAVWGDESGKAALARTCAAKGGLSSEWTTHPGFAWAFRREFFDEVGFYPWAVTGAGDTTTATGLLDVEMLSSTRRAIGELNFQNGVVDDWLRRAKAFMGGHSAGWVEGQVWHEWHGHRKDRQYVHRHFIMSEIEALKHVLLNRDGLLEWTAEATPKMREAVSGYFHARREDG